MMRKDDVLLTVVFHDSLIKLIPVCLRSGFYWS